uniref:Myosin_tail_1 domain-containing protein n=1 Tax=Ascaris lumbricoides TaxID=6252 RepID=A0A0M3IMY7_ASCLU
MSKEIDVAHKSRVNLDEEIKLLTKNIEDAQSEIRNSDKKEREIRIALNTINNEVGTAFGLQKAGANDKVDVKILKGISSRVNQQLSSLEKEKTIQDAYVTRMKRDVEASEKELAQLGKEFDELKKESAQRKSDYAELAEKLKAFEEGNISVEDRWQTLMKSLHSNNNKITLDRSETLDEKIRLLSKTAGGYVSEEELRKEAKELLKIESLLANREKIRRKKQQEFEQFEKALQETNSAIAKTKEELVHLEDGIIKLAVKAADTKRQYAALRNSKGLKESEDDESAADLEAIEEKIEKLRAQTILNRSKARKLAELVRARNQIVRILFY